MTTPKRASAVRVAILLFVAPLVWNASLSAKELEVGASWADESGITGQATKGSNITSAPVQTTRTAQEGVWGGAHVMMEITGSGATITYDCALGTVDHRIELDNDGRFDVQGTHTREHRGSVRSDETPDRHPARYAGRVDGKIMTLAVTLTDTQETVGTFSLTFGERPELHRCV